MKSFPLGATDLGFVHRLDQEGLWSPSQAPMPEPVAIWKAIEEARRLERMDLDARSADIRARPWVKAQEPPEERPSARFMSVDGYLKGIQVAALNQRPDDVEVHRDPLCGVINRLGEPCRREVYGGGPCYVHRRK
jgi:hypothetical protein